MLLDLTNRELASALLILALFAACLVAPNLRTALGGVAKAFFVWQIQASLAAYLAYSAGLVYLAWVLNLWDRGQLKDTIFTVVFVGLPMLFDANKVKEGKKLAGDVVRETVGVSALLLFYVNAASLPLWAELLVQPTLIFLALLAAVAALDPKHRVVADGANMIVGLVAIGMVVLTTVTVLTDWGSDEWAEAARSLALSVWLPLFLIPFVYCCAFLMHVETILTVLPFFNDRHSPPLRVRAAGVLGLRFSTRLASGFTGRWRGALAQTSTSSAARGVMKDYRSAVVRYDRDLKAYEQNLLNLTGAEGVDDQGLQLDRREFQQTKDALTQILYTQMGQYRNKRHKFWPDLPLDLFADDLPTEHGIQLAVRKDKQAWRAWRQTPCGWYFAVGGTKALDDQWQYDGQRPPDSFPQESSPGWINVTVRQSSAEWASRDAPPRGP